VKAITIREVFSRIEASAQRAAATPVLRSYASEVRLLVDHLSTQVGELRGRLLDEEDLIEQGQALLLVLEGKIADETTERPASPIHPVFRQILESFDRRGRQAEAA